MSYHPGHNTPTSQILFIFSLYVDGWNDQSLKICSKVNEIWKSDQNGCSGVNPPFWIYVFCNNFCSSHPFILQFGMGKFFGVWNSKITLRRLKNKPALRFEDFTFSVLVTRPVPINTCGWIDNYKKLFSSFINKFFSEKLFQPIIEPKMAFVSFLGSSEWCHKFWALLIDCTIVYSET